VSALFNLSPRLSRGHLLISKSDGYATFSEHRVEQFSLPAPPAPHRRAIGHAKFYSRSHEAVIRVYDEAGNVIETQEHEGDFKEA
jgi:hypothetical protein